MQLSLHWKTTGWGCSRNTYVVCLVFWWNKYAPWIANLDAAGIPLPHNWDISLNQRHQSLKGLSTSFSWCSGRCAKPFLPWHSLGSNKGWLQGFSWFCNGNYLDSLLVCKCSPVTVVLWICGWVAELGLHVLWILEIQKGSERGCTSLWKTAGEDGRVTGNAWHRCPAVWNNQKLLEYLKLSSMFILPYPLLDTQVLTTVGARRLWSHPTVTALISHFLCP